MALARLHNKVGKKGNAAAHASYVAREGQYERYTERGEKLEHKEYGNMPSWAEHDPQIFWKASDEYERKNGSVYREYEIALPRCMTPEQRKELVSDFVKQEIGEKKPYQYAIHNPKAQDGGEQPHVHLMFSERLQDGHERDPQQYFKRYNSKHPERGGAKKDNTGKTAAVRKTEIKELRQRWQDMANQHLEKGGYSERIDMRSYKERGIEIQPEKKMLPSQWKNEKTKKEIIEYREIKKEILESQAELKKEIPDMKAVILALNEAKQQQQRNSNLLHQEKGESLQQGLTARMAEIRAQAAERLKARQPTQAELDRQERFAATVEKLRARNGNQDMQTEQTRPNQKEETHKEFLERQDEERQRLAERQAQNLPNENAQGAILQERQQEEQQRIREQQEDQQQRVREQVEGQQQQVRDDAASRRESQEQARRQAQIMADMQAAQRHAARVDASEPNTRVTRKDISHLNESIKTGGLNDMAAQEWRGGIGVKSEKDLAIDSQILSSKIETEIMLKEYYTPANSIKQVREMMQGREARDQLQERLDKALQDNDGLRQENKELKDRIEALERRLESQAEAKQTNEQKDHQAQGKHQEQQHTHDAAEKHQDKQQAEQQIKQKELMSERANVHERAHEEKVIKAEQEHKPAQIEAERSASSQRMLEMRQRAIAQQAEKQYETASEQQRGQEMEQ